MTDHFTCLLRNLYAGQEATVRTLYGTTGHLDAKNESRYSLSSGHRTGKVVFILIQKKGNAKECSNYSTTVLISHVSKVMVKIIQARLQQYMNQELPDTQARFRKGRGTRDQIANIC